MTNLFTNEEIYKVIMASREYYQQKRENEAILRGEGHPHVNYVPLKDLLKRLSGEEDE